MLVMALLFLKRKCSASQLCRAVGIGSALRVCCSTVRLLNTVSMEALAAGLFVARAAESVLCVGHGHEGRAGQYCHRTACG